MFLPPDAALLRRESALAGISTLLDPEVFLARLRRALPQEDLCQARITYVKYVPAEKCLVGYDVRVGTVSVPMYARAYAVNAQRELQKPRHRTGLPGMLGPGRFVLDDCASVISVFPNDRRVKGLPVLADPAVRRRWLSEVLPDYSALWEASMQCLAYKPQRRYVARLSGPSGTGAVLKLYDDEGYQSAGTRSQAFTPRGVLRLPRCLGRSDRAAALAFEWLPGQSLRELLGAHPGGPEALVHVGAALAELHAQQPSGLPRRTPEIEVTACNRVAQAITFAHPDMAGHIRALARQFAAALENYPWPEHSLHGDFNPTQVLLDGAHVAFLDLDRAATGDPALDLGNFLGFLEDEALNGRLLGISVESLREGLLQGYGMTSDRSLLARVRLHTAAALLRRMDPFRYWEPRPLRPDHFSIWESHWPNRVEAIITRVGKLLTTVKE